VLPDVPVTVMLYCPAGVPLDLWRAVVTIFKVELTDPLPGVTADGVNEQLEAAGRPEQLKETDEPNVPPKADAVTV